MRNQSISFEEHKKRYQEIKNQYPKKDIFEIIEDFSTSENKWFLFANRWFEDAKKYYSEDYKKLAALAYTGAGDCFIRANNKNRAKEAYEYASKVYRELGDNENAEKNLEAVNHCNEINEEQIIDLEGMEKKEEKDNSYRKFLRQFHSPFLMKKIVPVSPKIEFVKIPIQNYGSIQNSNFNQGSISFIPDIEDPNEEQNETTKIVHKNAKKSSITRPSWYFLYEGMRDFFGKIWPLILLGLSLKDWMEFLAWPLWRYGNTAGEMLLGSTDWGQIWASYLGLDLAGEVMYWLPPALLWVLPIAGIALQFAVRCCYKDFETAKELIEYLEGENSSTWAEVVNPFSISKHYLGQTHFVLRLAKPALSEDEEEALVQALANIVNNKDHVISRRMYAANILADGGFADEIQSTEEMVDSPLVLTGYSSYLKRLYGKGKSNKLADAAFSITSVLWKLWQVYAFFRYGVMTFVKGEGAKEYVNAKTICESAQGLFPFVTAYANYHCVKCDYPYVSDIDKSSTQACLNGLLKFEKNATEILKNLPQLMRHKDYYLIDLSEQNLRNWTEEELLHLFGNFTQSGVKKLNMLNLSTETYTSRFPEGHAEIIGEFLNGTYAKTIDISNQGIGKSGLMAIFGSPSNVTVSIKLSNNQVTDEIVMWLSERFPLLEALDISGNPVSGLGLDSFTHLNNLDISETSITPDGLNLLLNCQQWIQQLRTFRLDKNTQLAGANWGQTITLLQNSSLRLLGTSGIGLDDDAVVAMANGIGASNIETWELRLNNVHNKGFVAILQVPKTTSLKKVELDGNPIDDDGLTIGAKFVNNTGITSISLSHIGGTKEGLIVFVEAANNGPITDICISDNQQLDDDFFIRIANSTVHFKHFDGSKNNFTDISGVVWANTLDKSSLESVVFSDTQFTDITLKVAAKKFPKSNLKVWISDNALMGGEGGLAAVADVLDKSSLEVFSVANCTFTDKETHYFIVSTIKNVANRHLIGIDYNLFQTRKIIENGESNSELKNVNLGGNLGSITKKAIELTQIVSGIHYGKLPENFDSENEETTITELKGNRSIYFNKEKRDEVPLNASSFFSQNKPVSSKRTWTEYLPGIAVTGAVGFLAMVFSYFSAKAAKSALPSQQQITPLTNPRRVQLDTTVAITTSLFAFMIVFVLLYRLYNHPGFSLNNNDNPVNGLKK